MSDGALLQRRLERERRARKEAKALLEQKSRELYLANKSVRLLQVAAVAANAATTLETALQTVVHQVCAHTGWPVGHVYVPGGMDRTTLVSTRIWHLEDPERFATFRQVTERTNFAVGSGLPGRVLASGKPAWITDVTQDTNFPRAQLVKDIGVKGGFAFPILLGSDVVAVLEFFSEHAVECDEALLEVMGHIGTQLGRVAERHRAQEQITSLARFASENPNPVLRIANDGRLLYANASSAPVLHIWDVGHGERLPDAVCALVSGTLRQGSQQEAKSPVASRPLPCCLVLWLRTAMSMSTGATSPNGSSPKSCVSIKKRLRWPIRPRVNFSPI